MYKNIIKFIDYFFDVHFMYCIALGLPYLAFMKKRKPVFQGLKERESWEASKL